MNLLQVLPTAKLSLHLQIFVTVSIFLQTVFVDFTIAAIQLLRSRFWKSILHQA